MSEQPIEADRLEQKAEDAARAAAEASGLPMAAWLSDAIRRSTEGVQGDAPSGEAAAVEVPHAAAEAPPAAPDESARAQPIAVGALTPGRFQMRQNAEAFNSEALLQSVRTHGILQPILARRRADDPERYEIIAGERRWRAANRLGLGTVPAIVLEVDDGEAMAIALAENLQREDLNPFEEAEGYRRLLDDYARTQDDVATIAGKSRSHVANTLRLLKLPDTVKSLVIDGRLSAGHARALVNAEDPAAAATQVVNLGLTVRQTEELVQGGDNAMRPPRDPEIRSVEKELSKYFGHRCRLNIRGDRGMLSIRFEGADGLRAIVRRLRSVTKD
ncbi:MAG: ParB/RepB/Spo0J family partition protein [Alphaproteobacteria bacterium]